MINQVQFRRDTIVIKKDGKTVAALPHRFPRRFLATSRRVMGCRKRVFEETTT